MKLGIGGKRCIGGKLGTSVLKYTVTYQVDTASIYTEKVAANKDILSPTTFTPSKSGWTFVGWRTNKTASGTVLSDAVATEDITLYAVYKKSITLSYSGNGSTSGSTASQTGTMYYNASGTTAGATFALRSNGFSKTYYSFSKWAMGSTSGTQYAAGESVTLSANTTFYAVWTYATGVTVAKCNDLPSTVNNTESGEIGNASGSWSTINANYMTLGSNGWEITVKKAGTYTYKMQIDSSNSGDTESYIQLRLKRNGSKSTLNTTYANGVNLKTETGTVTFQAGDIWWVNYNRKSNAFLYSTNFTLTT